MTTWPDLAIVLLTMGALLVLGVAYVVAAQAETHPLADQLESICPVCKDRERGDSQ